MSEPLTMSADRPYWIIWFDDADSDAPEVFTDEKSALERLAALGDSWSCHLFCQQELLDAERAAHKRTQLDSEEKEAACCPEDVGFPEYIKALEKQLCRTEEALAQSKKLQDLTLSNEIRWMNKHEAAEEQLRHFREVSTALLSAVKIAQRNSKHNRIHETQCWSTCAACVHDAAIALAERDSNAAKESE